MTDPKNPRWWALALLSASCCWLLPAQAQSPVSVRSIDHIVALVNSDPITNGEFRQRLNKVLNQIKAQGGNIPVAAQLNALVLEQLVSERAQLQRAQDLGLRVDPDSVAEAERRMAAQNGLSLEAFRQRLLAEGTTAEAFAFDLREQLLLQRLREREVDARIKVSESDIDDYIAEQQRLKPLSNLSLHLAQVMVAVPNNTDAKLLSVLQAKAQDVADRARRGEDFAALAKANSNANDAAQGGSLGMRTVDRLPELFVQATVSAPVGAVVGPVRSGAGFHVLKVIDREQLGLPDATLTQTRSRHILLRPNEQESEATLVARMQRWREQMVGGRVSFESLARQHSQDGSAPTGGDLGWASPGQFVPEFEVAMDALRPGEVSPVVVSRFGVHLIRVDERRQVPMTLPQQRAMVRNLLRQEKARTALAQWQQDIRGQAFVEYREAPRP